MRDLQAEEKVRRFYDERGWNSSSPGVTLDAQLWEDLRPAAKEYVKTCRLKLKSLLPQSGHSLLDAASGPVQYPEYLEYSRGFDKRVCVDISESALEQARQKLGERGEYVRASILELPFVNNHFDAVISLHTIYHIDKDQQEAAVRQLIRVAKPEVPIIIVYANPDRLLARLKRSISGPSIPAPAPLYYFANPLTWWKRFEDSCEVRLLPWRSLTAQDSRRFIPNSRLGELLFKLILKVEKTFPNLATQLGAYPMIVLQKRPQNR